MTEKTDFDFELVRDISISVEAALSGQTRINSILALCSNIGICIYEVANSEDEIDAVVSNSVEVIRAAITMLKENRE